MATDFNSKYTGEQVEELLDQVASGGTGGGESDIYIWEFNGSLEDGASGTIEREVFEKLAEAKSLWLRYEGSYTVCDYHVGDSSSLFMLFTTIQQDIMSNCAITIDGETLQYNVAGYEISIQEAIEDLEDIRSGAEKGATALQEIPSDVVRSSNIKTINGESILGSGNIEIGSGDTSGGGSAYPVVNHSSSETLVTIAPNTFHIWDNVSGNLTIRLGAKIDGIANEYLFQFTTAMGGASLTLQDNIKWNNGDTISITTNSTYQVSILEDIAVYASISLGLSTDPA